jgi:hypothetical protein
MMLLVAACASSGSGTQATLEVEAFDYGYVGLPGEIPAGTAISLGNTSSSEVHEFVAIRLPDDETRSVAELVQLPPEELSAFFPGLATVLIAPPGEEGFVVEGDGTLSEPGRYAVICVIPTGADPAAYLEAAAASEGGPPEVPGGPPHIANGMFAEITVTP